MIWFEYGVCASRILRNWTCYLVVLSGFISCTKDQVKPDPECLFATSVLKSTPMSNGIRQLFTYDANKRLTSRQIVYESGITVSSDFEYNSDGRMDKILAGGDSVSLFEYDNSGRLISQTVTANSNPGWILITSYTWGSSALRVTSSENGVVTSDTQFAFSGKNISKQTSSYYDNGVKTEDITYDPTDFDSALSPDYFLSKKFPAHIPASRNNARTIKVTNQIYSQGTIAQTLVYTITNHYDYNKNGVVSSMITQVDAAPGFSPIYTYTYLDCD